MQNIIIPQSMEQRVSWKTTLDAVVAISGISNTFNVQLTDVVTDASPAPIAASFYKFFVRPFYREDLTVMYAKDFVPIPENSTSLQVIIDIPGSIKRGYYLLQLVLYDANQSPVNTYTTYLCVNSAITPLKDNPYMTLESVRAEFGDISFKDNHLLDSQEIGTWDICNGVYRAIEQWNNTAPRIQMYSGETFPYPEILRRGVIYMLLQTLWTLLERNRMNYAAGNTSVDLEKRADAYLRLKNEYLAMWRAGVEQAKNEENLLQFNKHMGYL